MIAALGTVHCGPAAASGLTWYPQKSQNTACSGKSLPQFGQAGASHCPHWRQKRASARLEVWQRGQFTASQMYHEEWG
jgi:hypothetical protein